MKYTKLEYGGKYTQKNPLDSEFSSRMSDLMAAQKSVHSFGKAAGIT